MEYLLLNEPEAEYALRLKFPKGSSAQMPAIRVGADRISELRELESLDVDEHPCRITKVTLNESAKEVVLHVEIGD